MPSLQRLAMCTVLAAGLTVALEGQVSAPQAKPSADDAAKAVVAAHPVKHAKKRASKKHAALVAKKEQPAAPAHAQPVIPATLLNSPAVAPEVTLRDGQLFIDAPNSNLSEVLSDVRRLLGAELEGPSPTERIAVKLGPGSPEQVLGALLQGTPYDYIIVGQPDAPQKITRIVLSTPGTGGDAASHAEAAHDSGAQGAMAHRREMNNGAHREPPPDAQDSGEENQEADQQPSDNQPAATDSQQPKSPDQLLHDLQQKNQPPGQQISPNN
ncbi:MAG: hypothetical protein P4M01_14255 [Acidobacteriota bacterium]|nr:hypothetical protein [Acidobacteriota bacterium]